jgi:ABC-type cobalamin/Fe3+-siderophores transport system ATPase subunit
MNSAPPKSASSNGHPPGSDGLVASEIVARDLSVRLGGDLILEAVDVALAPGRITALVGPNGSGKSTLLRTISRILRPDGGTVVLDGDDIAQLPTRMVARRLALLPQRTEAMSGVTVRALVELGRQPYIGRFGGLRASDREAIAWALDATNSTQHVDRLVDTLSGGERQRAWLAVALAQRTGVLLLDEPTTYLDVRHQLEVMALVRDLNERHGLTVCWVLHDLNAAAAYSDAMVCLSEGRVVAQGTPTELLTAELVRDAFGIDATVIADPRSGLPVCLPHGPIPDPIQGEP